MNDPIRRALSSGHVIDITTTGRRSGQARRIEIVFHNVDGRLYITGMPNPNRTRGWIHNLEQDPRLRFHLKGSVQADLMATARVVTDDSERRFVLGWVVANAWKQMDVEAMIQHSPLIEVVIDDLAA